jgi:formylglycine-generating enzyme required for sulfatase activity
MSRQNAYYAALETALLEAFPTRAALAKMVKFGLGHNLPTIAEGANLAEAVFQLISWAEDQAGLAALVAAAQADNPTNTALQALATTYDWAAIDQGLREAPACPYPGMRAFTGAEAPHFYGRDAEVQELLIRLRHERFLMVVGPSGSGKSSLVYAGLLPALTQSSYWPAGTWLVRDLRPGAHPLEALATTLGGAPSPETVMGLLAAHAPATRVLLVIDQFEELFALAARESQIAFIAALQTLRAEVRCTLLLTMRADFYADLMTSALWPVAPSQRLEVASLRGPALRAAITRPATRVGVTLEPDLLQRLLDEVGAEPGVLPLLQETLVLLWGTMKNRVLTLSAYEALGATGQSGLAVALAAKADAMLAALSAESQRIARRIFLRLVQFGEGRPDTRRQQPIGALRAAGDDPTQFAATLQTLVDSRLLTLNGSDTADATTQVDIAHEVLIDGWPQLARWIADYKPAESTRRRLLGRAQQWIPLRHPGTLLDKTELAEFRTDVAIVKAAHLGPDPDVVELLLASTTALHNRARWQWTAGIAGLVVLLAAVGAVPAYHEGLRQQARALSPTTVVAGGLATIGVNAPDEDADLGPAWQYPVPDLAVDTYEVSNQGYCLCWQAGACPDKPDKPNSDICTPAEAPYPVVYVTQSQAQTYCTWLGRTLPTEVEWEWIARGSQNRRYPTGDPEPAPGQVNIGDGNQPTPYWAVATPTTDHTPAGILTMAGNVREWTLSPALRYTDTTYQPAGPIPAGGLAIARGGSWGSGDLISAQSVVRYPVEVTETLDDLGFRCVQPLPEGARP